MSDLNQPINPEMLRRYKEIHRIEAEETVGETKPNGHANGNGAAHDPFAPTPEQQKVIDALEARAIAARATNPEPARTVSGEGLRHVSPEPTNHKNTNGSSLKVFAEDALRLGFKVFPLLPKKKKPLKDTHGYKDASSDPAQIEAWWASQPNSNIGIATGDSGLAVLDFDSVDNIPTWVMELKTFKVSSSRGVHVYVRGARPGEDMYANGKHVGEIKSIGGYVLGAGSIHPTGAVYAILDDSPIAEVSDDKIIELTVKPASSTPSSGSGKSTNGSPSLVVPLLDGEDIPNGLHDKTMHAHAGFLREHKRLEEYEEVLEALLDRTEQYIDRGEDFVQMAEKHASNACAKYPVGEEPVLALVNGVPAGTNPVVAPADHFVDRTPEQLVELKKELVDAAEAERLRVVAEIAEKVANWRSLFRSVDELDDRPVEALIDGFLPKGTSFLGGLSGEMKTLLALSICKALTTGQPFLGQPDFTVPERRSVIYMIPEADDAEFRARLKLFGITNDEKWFLCRTISQGLPLELNNPGLLEAIKQMNNPVVILDTMVRFNEADDENSAAQNKELAEAVVGLRVAGAVAVLLIHHAQKNLRKLGMKLETVLRGTGDLGAMANCVWGMLRDEKLWDNGAGVNEAVLSCLKPRDLRPQPLPIRIAASHRISPTVIGLALGIGSYIDETGDFKVLRRNKAPVDPNPAHPNQALSDAAVLEKARDLIASAYGQGRTINKSQLSTLLALNRHDAERILSGTDKAWSQILGAKNALYFVPKGCTSLPVSPEEKAKASKAAEREAREKVKAEERAAREQARAAKAEEKARKAAEAAK